MTKDSPVHERKSRFKWIAWIAAAAVVGVLIYLLPVGQWANAVLGPIREWMEALLRWIRGAGAVGVVVFGIAYIIATVASLPGSILTLGAGVLYGPIWGTVLVSPVSVIGAALAFLIGRFVARERIAKRVADRPKFAAIDEAVGREGFKIVFLLRLSPIFPFNLLNYALGLTDVRFWHYVLASFVGMLPGTFMYVYIGSLIPTIAGVTQGGAPDPGIGDDILYYGGLVATVIVTIFVTRIAKRALAEKVGEKVVEGELTDEEQELST